MARNSNLAAYKLVALLLIVPSLVTVVVGVDYVIRGLDIGQLHLPRGGLWAVVIGACCLATGWVAKQGLTALWKKL
jgi:hypothetical protein